MDVVIDNRLVPGTDYGTLELAPDPGAWPAREGRARALLVSFNTPGYYSLAVRILALTAHLSPTVKDSWDVRYIEADSSDDGQALAAAIVGWRPEVVAFSVNIWNLKRCLETLPALKRALPSTALVLGGQEVTNSVTDFLAGHPEVDYIIDGEGEIPFLQFLAAWDPSTHRPRDPMQVSGLRYRRDGTTVLSGPAQLVQDLDDLPSPILAGLVPVRTKNKLGVMLEGARGCPYQCSFCFEGSRVTKVRMASIDRLSAEARLMASQGATYFHLMDPILCNSKPERLKGIADLFKDLNSGRKMQISLETYAQHIHDGIAAYLADFTIIDVGLQSINPDTQKEIRRSFSMERFREGLASLRAVNPNFNLYLICGLPHETLLSFLKGIQFVINERPLRIFINELCLLNGTELRRRAAEYGYDFSTDPPYKVHASRWMGRLEMQVANALSNAVYRRYNFSIRALFPLAPWVRNTSPGIGERVTLDLRGGPGPETVERVLQAAAGCDVELIVQDDPLSPAVMRIIGQLQLMGASRLQMTAPLGSLAHPDVIGKLVSLGVLHFKTAVSAGPQHADELPAQLERLSNISRTFTIKGYAAIKPISEIVVQCNGADRSAYRLAVEQACGSAADIITVPADIPDRGDDWNADLAACFRDQAREGKWLKLPRRAAAAALDAIQDRDAVLDALGRLSLLSRETAS